MTSDRTGETRNHPRVKVRVVVEVIVAAEEDGGPTEREIEAAVERGVVGQLGDGRVVGLTVWDSEVRE